MKVRRKAKKEIECKPSRVWEAGEFFKLAEQGVIKTTFTRDMVKPSLSAGDERFLKSVTAGHHRNN